MPKFVERENFKADRFFAKVKTQPLLKIDPDNDDGVFNFKNLRASLKKNQLKIYKHKKLIFSFKRKDIKEMFFSFSNCGNFLLIKGEYLHTDITKIYLINLKDRKIVGRWTRAFGSTSDFFQNKVIICGRGVDNLESRYHKAELIEFCLETFTEKVIYTSQEGSTIMYFSKLKNDILIHEIRTQMQKFNILRDGKIFKSNLGIEKWSRQDLFKTKSNTWRLVQTKTNPYYQLQKLCLNKQKVLKSYNFKGWVTTYFDYSEKSDKFFLVQMNSKAEPRIVVFNKNKIVRTHNLPLGTDISESFYHSDGSYFIDFNYLNEKGQYILTKTGSLIKTIDQEFTQLKDLTIKLKKCKNNWVFIYQLGDKPLVNRSTIIYTYGGFAQNFLVNPVEFYSHLKKGGILCDVWPRGQINESFRRRINSSRGDKTKTIQDIISATKYLINKKISAKGQIGITGASNGGFVVGAVINKAPQLYSAAVTEVGVMDLCNYSKFTGGDVWVCEYGKNIKKLKQCSPLENISNVKKYPPIYVISGKYDTRVAPTHQIKYAQTLKSKGHKVYFQQFKQGHSINIKKRDQNVCKFFDYYLNQK
jgi:predicted esterase